jgi:hypothetical protein
VDSEKESERGNIGSVREEDKEKEETERGKIVREDA